MADIGTNIANARKKAGMTQEDLALKVGYKTRSSINKIEMGKRDLPQRKIAEIAYALGVSPASLLESPDAEQQEAPASSKAEALDSFESVKTALMRVIDERTGGRPLTVQERTVIESAFKLLSTMFDDPE